MKDFRSVLSDYLNKHDRHRKQLAAVVSLSMLVSFSVPMILTEPAVSMTQDSFSPVGDILSTQLMNSNNISNKDNSNSLSDVTLLVGSNNKDGFSSLNTVEQVSSAMRKKYFLGLASDFCVFLEENFQPTAADAEGRVAVGGSVVVDGGIIKNYQIGAGDFITSTPLKDTDNYEQNDNFAHLIIGKESMPVYKITCSEATDWLCQYTNETYDSQKFIYDVAPFGTTNSGSNAAVKDWVKRIVVPTDFDFDKSLHDNNGSMENYNGKHTHASKEIYEPEAFYPSSEQLIDFSSEFAYLRKQSDNLSKVKSTGDSFNVVEENWKGDKPYPVPTLKFDGKGAEGDVNAGKDTIYFDINAEELAKLNENNSQILFDNIPDNANIVINVSGKKAEIKKSIQAYINGTEIYKTNNTKACEKILYNFYEAEEITINGNFNGTILAPNAAVKSNKDCQGHLSGALIAKSYLGGMEFGYRPYRGTVDILGASNGYIVPFNKFVSGTENFLSGATFGIYDGNELISTFTSGNGTEYVNIPSKVDFDKSSENAEYTTTYTIKEISAPTGFVIDDTTEYTVTITEKVLEGNFNDPAEGGSGILTGRPSKVQATVTISSNKAGYAENSFSILLNDIWGYDESSGRDAIIRREITIGEGENAETFYLDMENGKITAVSKKEGEPIAKATAIVTGADIVSAKTSKEVDTDIPVTAYKTQVVTKKVTDEDGNPVTEVVYEEDGTTPVIEYVTAADGSTETEVVTTRIDKVISGGEPIIDTDGLTPITLDGVICKNLSNNCQYKLVIYYSNGSTATVTDTGTSESKLKLDDISKDNIVAIAVKFDNTVDTDLTIQKIENGQYSDTFGTEWNNTHNFNADTYYVFASNTNSATGTTPSETTPTETEVSYSTVTTAITTVSYYTTSSHITSVINIDKYNTIFDDVNNAHTYNTETTVADYYYDPNAMMMMPLPSNTPTFENDYGLIFEKVDDEGKPVSGATIEIQHHYYDFKDNKWKWVPINDVDNILNGGSSTTIDLKNIQDEEEWGSDWNHVHQRKVYRLVETYTPDYYETADHIYFVKDGNTIHYKSSKTEITSMPLNESTWDGWSSVDLTKNNTTDRETIEMVDIKISGAKIKLSKYDSDFKNNLTGATFKLYASNDDLIYPLSGTFTIDGEDLDLFDKLRKAEKTEYNTSYVQNGYLKPGSYYLEEITAPDGYDAQDKFGFRVKSDYSIEAVDAGTPSYFNTTVGSGTAVWIYPQNAEGEKISVSNVTKIEIELNSPTSGNLELWEGPFNGDTPSITDGTVVLDNLDNVSFESFKIQNKNYNDGVDVKEVRIYGEEGSGGSSSRAYNLSQIAWNDGNISKVNKLTLYYADGTNASKNNVSWSGDNNWAMFDLNGLILDNVVGLTIDFEGTAKIYVQDNTYNNVLDSGVEASGTCSFGNTNVNTGNETTDSESTKSEEETADLAVQVSGDTIKIPNKKSGDKITITVEKAWKYDAGFEDLRPESIEVQLKRNNPDGSEDDEFNSNNTYKATLDSSNDWKKSWSGLDRYDGDETQLYTYYVAEIDVNDNYNVSYDADNDGDNDTLTSGGTLKITNTLKTIDIDIEKKWETKGCDDAVIPNSIEVKVQFKKADDDDSKWADVMKPVETINEDGETVSKPETLTLKLTKNGEWKGELKNLPEIYEYRLVEMNVPIGWESNNNDTAKKDDLSASITNTFMTGSLGVEKNWANDKETDRPNSLTITLYRTTKAPITAPEPDTSKSDEDTQINQLAENAEESISTETYEDITVTEGETIVLSTGDEGILILADSDKTVEWNNTENDKIKVEDGILTVLDEGITTISATIDDTPTIFNVNVKIASVVPDITGMQKVKDIETFDKSGNSWTANVENLPIYSPDGKPYYYYIIEKYDGADGKTVTGNNCTYYSVSYNDAVTLINATSDSTPTLSVTNEKVDTEGITLPEAGGSGTHNYYIAGICLIGVAGMFWFIRRRRTAK